MEALGIAQQVRYGELDYMSSALPDMEESDIISSFEGRIYFNPEENAYEVADKFISGNVIEKAERIESWLLDHPDHEEANRALLPFACSHTNTHSICRPDFNLGERWIPAKVYGRSASSSLGRILAYPTIPTWTSTALSATEKNANIWHKYAVQWRVPPL